MIPLVGPGNARETLRPSSEGFCFARGVMMKMNKMLVNQQLTRYFGWVRKK